MSARRVPALAFALGALVAAAAARGEVRQIEAIGAIPLHAGAHRSSPPRDAAVRSALDDAVRQVARDLVPEMGVAEADEVLPEILGSDPFEFTSRFRIVEDRGEVPASITDGAGSSFEYVVVVEAHIDADRVERRLADAGMLWARRDAAPVRPLTIVVEDLSGYPAYAALLSALLETAGALAAVPIEFTRGRAVIAVEASEEPTRLLAALREDAPPELRVTPVDIAGDVLTLRVEYTPPPAEAGTAAARTRN